MLFSRPIMLRKSHLTIGTCRGIEYSYNSPGCASQLRVEKEGLPANRDLSSSSFPTFFIGNPSYEEVRRQALRSIRGEKE
jgi:hypothetical protein